MILVMYEKKSGSLADFVSNLFLNPAFWEFDQSRGSENSRQKWIQQNWQLVLTGYKRHYDTESRSTKTTGFYEWEDLFPCNFVATSQFGVSFIGLSITSLQQHDTDCT